MAQDAPSVYRHYTPKGPAKTTPGMLSLDGPCPTRNMPTRSSKPKDRDFATNARRVVEQAIGERLDGTALPDPSAGKNPAAVALGKLGGAKGGRARALKLTPEQRTDIARVAAETRWKKNP
jgi:hypothetical protein